MTAAPTMTASEGAPVGSAAHATATTSVAGAGLHMGSDRHSPDQADEHAPPPVLEALPVPDR